MKTMKMGFYRLTFSIWTFLSFFFVNSCSESALKSDFTSTNRFFKDWVFLAFSSILLFRGGWLWLQLFCTWSHVTRYWIIKYESSGPHLEGGSKVEPMSAAKWPEIKSDKNILFPGKLWFLTLKILEPWLTLRMISGHFKDEIGGTFWTPLQMRAWTFIFYNPIPGHMTPGAK